MKRFHWFTLAATTGLLGVLMFRMSAPDNCQNNGYKYPWPSLSFKLWPQLPKFYKNNRLNIDRESNLMQAWLDSDLKSYNVFKWLNSNLWK